MVISKDGRQMKGFSLLLCSFRYYFIFIKMYPVLLIILKQNIFSEWIESGTYAESGVQL